MYCGSTIVLMLYHLYRCLHVSSLVCVKPRTQRRNRTELKRFGFWRTDQWARRASSFVIGRRVRERSHVSPTSLDGSYCNGLPFASWSKLNRQFTCIAVYAPNAAFQYMLKQLRQCYFHLGPAVYCMRPS